MLRIMSAIVRGVTETHVRIFRLGQRPRRFGAGRTKFFKDYVLRDDLPTGLKFVTALGRVGTSVTLQERYPL
jgi:hypothetical protein